MIFVVDEDRPILVGVADFAEFGISVVGVGDFPALLDKRRADVRYLKRLRSVSAAADMAGGAS